MFLFLVTLFNGSRPNLFLPFVPSAIKKNRSIIPPIKGIKLISKKKPDRSVSCSLLTPAEIAGIRVNNVCSGGLKGHVAGKSSQQEKNFVKNYSKKVPLKRLGEPEEIVSAPPVR